MTSSADARAAMFTGASGCPLLPQLSGPERMAMMADTKANLNMVTLLLEDARA